MQNEIISAFCVIRRPKRLCFSPGEISLGWLFMEIVIVVWIHIASMTEWAKGFGHLVHIEAWCAGGCGFDPQPGQYTRNVLHTASLPGKVFSVNMSLYFKLWIYLEL